MISDACVFSRRTRIAFLQNFSNGAFGSGFSNREIIPGPDLRSLLLVLGRADLLIPQSSERDE